MLKYTVSRNLYDILYVYCLSKQLYSIVLIYTLTLDIQLIENTYMTKNPKEQVSAYSGKYVSVGNKTYSLVPETINKGCKGCALESTYRCYRTVDSNENVVITDLCRQGFILKRTEV